MSKCTVDHKHGVEASSPLATIEDIHKRLTRPPLPPQSQLSSSSVIASHLYELQHQNSSNVDTSPLQKQKKLTPPPQQFSSSVIEPHLHESQHENSSQSKSKLNIDTSPLQKQRKLTRPADEQFSSSVIAPHLYELQHQNSSNVDTSPLQKRRKLTRPADQQSSSTVIAPHLYELQHQNSTNVDPSPFQKRRKSRAVKVRLEDYFDLSLLSTIRAKMNSSLKKQNRKMKVKSEFEEFVWPAAGDHHDSEVFSESNSRRTDEAIVDLKNDDDDDDSFGDGEENHVCCVDPFQRFESTALMRFKR